MTIDLSQESFQIIIIEYFFLGGREWIHLSLHKFRSHGRMFNKKVVAGSVF